MSVTCTHPQLISYKEGPFLEPYTQSHYCYQLYK